MGLESAKGVKLNKQKRLTVGEELRTGRFIKDERD